MIFIKFQVLERVPREAFADIEEQEEPEDHFDEISLGGAEIIANKNPPLSPLFQQIMTPSGFHSLPQSIGPKKSTNGSFCGSSWEANNHLVSLNRFNF